MAEFTMALSGGDELPVNPRSRCLYLQPSTTIVSN